MREVPGRAQEGRFGAKSVEKKRPFTFLFGLV